jgi:Leucine-rich repeat (LRR) protein
MGIVNVSLVVLFFIATVILLYMILSRIDDDSYSINDRIEEVCKNNDVKYSEITELELDPGYGTFRGTQCYLLNELTNLESITFTGIVDDMAAQLIFEELVELKNLRSVEIRDSRLDSIAKLAGIEALTDLSISTKEYTDNTIEDLDLLGYNGRFVNLKSLKLNVGLQELPDLTGLTELTSLTINDLEFEKMDYECANWENLVELNIWYTSIDCIDDRIVEELYNLETLNISGTDIIDIRFVLKLPKLKKFIFYDNREFPVDKEPLREHPNFKSYWLFT